MSGGGGESSFGAGPAEAGSAAGDDEGGDFSFAQELFAARPGVFELLDFGGVGGFIFVVGGGFDLSLELEFFGMFDDGLGEFVDEIPIEAGELFGEIGLLIGR